MGMTDAERNIELLRQLAEARESNATLQRILERQSYQIERMNDQLERALRELAMLRRQLNKPPPDEPPPDEPPPGTAAVPPGPVEVPEAPPRPARPPKKKKSRYGRSELPKNLERVVDAREPEACAKCGGTNAKILRETTVEILDYQPARVVVRQTTRPICRCTGCQNIAAAPYPDDLIPRLLATPGLIAHIIYEKFGRHLPLNRIDQELKRLGVTLKEATRDSWLTRAAKILDRLMIPLRRALFEAGLVHTDGTGLDVLAPGVGTRLGQMAVFCNPIATIYDFTPTKEGVHQRRFLGLENAAGEAPNEEERKVLPLFRGFVIADAASTADRTFRHIGVIECGCNAHAFRKFEDAEESQRIVAGEALAFWRALYAIEAQATREKLDADARLARRSARSAPIVADFRRWLDRHLGQYLPREPLTRALNYLHNHWDALMRFLTNGQIPLDNNLAERQLRAVAVGRKNYLFAGSDDAARRSAIFYTFISTCRQHGVDPVAWLTDVLPRIETTRRDRLAELLPQNWTMTAVETRTAA